MLMAAEHEPPESERRDDDAEDAQPERPRQKRMTQAEANALVMVWNSMQGVGSPRSRSWIDWKLIVPIAIGFLSTAAVQLRAYTQLGDQVGDFARRLEIVERISIDHAKEIAVQGNTNMLQDERLQNFTRAIEQERQARQEAEADMRRSDADQRSILTDLSRLVGEMRADFKVVVDRFATPRRNSTAITTSRDEG